MFRLFASAIIVQTIYLVHTNEEEWTISPLSQVSVLPGNQNVTVSFDYKRVLESPLKFSTFLKPVLTYHY